MNKFFLLLTTTLLYIFTSSPLMAASVEVTWTNPDKYRDIDSGEQHRKHFKERIFKKLEKHFAELADTLPKDQLLKIDVTDVDLAGDVHHGGIRQIRIVKDVYFPRMELSYQLVNADKTMVTSGDAKLKDMRFLSYIGPAYKNESLGHEKKMLDDWFKATFSGYIK